MLVALSYVPQRDAATGKASGVPAAGPAFRNPAVMHATRYMENV